MVTQKQTVPFQHHIQLDEIKEEEEQVEVEPYEESIVESSASEINSDDAVDLDEEKEEIALEENEEETLEAPDFNSNSYIIKDEKVSEILEKLVKLEQKKYYLKQECTLHSVAKKLKTNTAYLSKIINSELGKNFNTYINELRINYVLIELKNNPRLRSYSVRGIANEIGYKQPQAYVKNFKQATGLSTGTYIKKISKLAEE